MTGSAEVAGITYGPFRPQRAQGVRGLFHMFERYSEKARRVIFFARHEAGELGSSAIEAHHLLLGLVREDQSTLSRFSLVAPSTLSEIRDRVRARAGAGDRLGADVDMPLSPEVKNVLIYAADESKELDNRYLGPEHLLLGILRAEGSLGAEILIELGIDLEAVRRELRGGHAGSARPGSTGAVEEMRKLAADARQLAASLIKRAEHIDALCDQIKQESSVKEDPDR